MSKLDGNLANVVIVGGGGAGALIARNLSAKLDPSKYNLILVTARPHFLHLVACIRMVVTAEAQLEEKALIPYDANFIDGNGTLVIGTVTAIEEHADGAGEVVLASGERVQYAVLVFSTGSSWEGPLAIPGTKSETAEWVKQWRERFAEAGRVVFVGGGAVGVEYAGEIQDAFKGKNVTIVHSDRLLFNDTYPDKWRKDVERRLRLRGVDVILGDAIEQIPPSGSGTVTTRNGRSISADLFVVSRGPRPNTSFIGSSLGSELLSPTNYVKIMPTLQIPSHPSIFAAGDIIDFPEQKQVFKYEAHASVVVTNILSILAGKPPRRVYKKSFEAIIVTIGKTGGASYIDLLWGLMFGDWFARFMKSKGLMISMFWKRLGLKP